jgi:hypothetical protein
MLSTFPNFLEDRRMRQLLTPWQYSQMQGQHSQTDSESVLASTRAFVGAHRRILRAGGIVLCGTDEPLGLNIWGLQATVAGLVHYGDFTEHEALRTVTALPAEVMGLKGEIGTVERGAIADLLFIRGNPLDHIQDLFNLDMVMKNGRLYTIDDLIAPYADAEPASAASSNGDAPTTVAPASGGSMRRHASRARAPLGAFVSFEDGTVDYGVDQHCRVRAPGRTGRSLEAVEGSRTSSSAACCRSSLTGTDRPRGETEAGGTPTARVSSDRSRTPVPRGSS